MLHITYIHQHSLGDASVVDLSRVYTLLSVSGLILPLCLTGCHRSLPKQNHLVIMV